VPKVKSVKDVPAQTVDPPAVGVTIRVLISPDDGAPNYVMRLFTVEPGGRTPFHTHSWEHEVYVLEGRGVVVGENAETPIEADQVVFVPGGEKHCFRNTGESPLRFLCIIPVVEK